MQSLPGGGITSWRKGWRKGEEPDIEDEGGREKADGMHWGLDEWREWGGTARPGQGRRASGKTPSRA